MPRLLALAIENYDSPIAGVRTRIAPKWLSALPIPPKKKLYDMRLESGEWTATLSEGSRGGRADRVFQGAAGANR